GEGLDGGVAGVDRGAGLDDEIAVGDGDALGLFINGEAVPAGGGDEGVGIFADAAGDGQVAGAGDGDDLTAVAGAFDARLGGEAGAAGDGDAGGDLDQLLAVAAVLNAGFGGFAGAAVDGEGAAGDLHGLRGE